MIKTDFHVVHYRVKTGKRNFISIYALTLLLNNVFISPIMLTALPSNIDENVDSQSCFNSPVFVKATSCIKRGKFQNMKQERQQLKGRLETLNALRNSVSYCHPKD